MPANGVKIGAEFETTLIASKLLGPPSSVSIFAPARVQFCEPERSPNFNPPIVRALSRVTVRSAVRSSVLKSAAKPVPLATTPLLQLPVALQLPLASLVHTPPG